MKHKHHVMPRYLNGTDDESNIVELTIEEHANAHKELYEKYGNWQDYIAWKGLDGSISKEDIIYIKCSEAGKKGVDILRNKKICAYFNDELRYAIGEKGRLKCKENGKGFYDSELQSELGKRGGVNNKGFVWINDGNVSVKYTKIMQYQCSVGKFIKDNPQYTIGRIDTHVKVECPHCGKIGSEGAMKLNHFDNCPIDTGVRRTFKINETKCPYCGKVGAGGSMKRWHFGNCRENI